MQALPHLPPLRMAPGIHHPRFGPHRGHTAYLCIGGEPDTWIVTGVWDEPYCNNANCGFSNGTYPPRNPSAKFLQRYEWLHDHNITRWSLPGIRWWNDNDLMIMHTIELAYCRDVGDAKLVAHHMQELHNLRRQ